jgi:hypothetical protein
MKSKSTLKFLFAAFIAAVFNLSLYSQAKIVTICPEGCDYDTLVNAFNAVKADAVTYPDGSDVIFQLSEGVHKYAGTFANLGRHFNPTFQGAGAGKTILLGADSRISAEVSTGRFLNMAQANNSNANVIIRDVTFRNWGTLATNQGMIVNAAAAAAGVKVSFINCNFESIVARNGAVINSNAASQEVIFDNCYFYDCESLANVQKHGIIFKGAGGKLTIRNSTFYSNVNNPIDLNEQADLNLRKPGIISLSSAAGETMDVVLEGNVFANNLVVPAGSEAVQMVMEFIGNPGATNSLTVNDNIFIANYREGKDKDVDIVLINPASINITGSGNLVNRIITYTGDAGSEEITPIDNAAFSAGMFYNYTNPAIAFTMDGDNPKILTDEFGVKYIGQEPVFVRPSQKNSHFRVYSYNTQVVLEGLNAGDLFEVYTITGSRLLQGKAEGYRTVVELPKGLFILRSGTSAHKVMIR